MDADQNRACEDQPSAESPRTNAVRKVDPPDSPPRPLGSKRSALFSQKHRQFTSVWRAGLTGSAARPRGQVFTSADGALAFTVLPTKTGLMVERSHYASSGKRTVQTMAFDSAVEFDRWCDLEPVRFSAPLLHRQLRREGHEALDSAG